MLEVENDLRLRRCDFVVKTTDEIGDDRQGFGWELDEFYAGFACSRNVKHFAYGVNDRR